MASRSDLEGLLDRLVDLGRRPVRLRGPPPGPSPCSRTSASQSSRSHRSRQVGQAGEQEGAPLDHLGMGAVVRREEFEAAPRGVGRACGSGRPDRAPPRRGASSRTTSSGVRSVQSSRTAGGAPVDQLGQRVADAAQAELDGQVDQVEVEARQALRGRSGQRLVADGAGDRGVEDREVGVDPRLVGVAAEPLAAELVEGADRRRLQAAEDRAPAAGRRRPRRAGRGTPAGCAGGARGPPCR